VDAVVEGTVLVTKERVRVSAQLVYGATDEHLWAEIYDRDLGDVLALHSELAQVIAREIHTVVTPEEAERIEKKYRVAPAVLDAHLKGRYFLGKFTPPDGDRAIGWFEQAIAGDDLFAEAHAGLAGAYLMRGMPTGNNYSVRKQQQFLVMARTAAERAAGYYHWALAAQVGAMGDRPADGADTRSREDELPFFRARNYARLGGVDNAIKCLEQSYKERDGRMVLLKAWEWFDPLRSDPRFQSKRRLRNRICECETHAICLKHVKCRCAREDIVFDNDIFNELVG
jgi:hypothetical protein